MTHNQRNMSCRFATASALSLTTLLACTSHARTQPYNSSAGDVVSVSGTQFTLNGQSWMPKAVTIRAFVAPAAYEKAHNVVAYTALQNYGPKEFLAARKFGVDTLRLQVNQPVLDSTSPHYDARYFADVVAGVKLARQYGFVVIIMMQDETQMTGITPQNPLATIQTVRAWDELNRFFRTDRGVIYELYNEPELPESEANWALWAYGGSANQPGFTAVPIGMEPLLVHLRNEGSQNTFIVDGLDFAATLQGVIVLKDPLKRLVYAVHPYPKGVDAANSNWDARFGNASQVLPVFADEWSAEAGLKLGLRQLPTYQVAIQFLNYLQCHHIPLGAAAFDAPGEMVQNVPGWLPTNYDNYAPHLRQYQDDAGLLVRSDFLSNYKMPLTAADGVTH